MGTLRLTLQHFVACPCLPFFFVRSQLDYRRLRTAVGPCLQRLAHGIAQAGCKDAMQPLAWVTGEDKGSGRTENGDPLLQRKTYGVTKEKLQVREEDKENLVSEVLGLVDEMFVKDVLSSWVKKVGSRRLLRESAQVNSTVSSSGTARYVPYGEVARTVNAVMKDLGQRGHSNAALQVFRWMQLQGWCKLDPHLYTTVIDTLGSSGCLELAEKIFAELDDTQVKKDTVLHNALLHSRSKAGQVEAVLEMFHAMKEKSCRPDLVTFNIVMNMHVKPGMGLASVVSLFKEMCLQGIQPDIVSYDILLAACASGQHVKEAQRIFAALKRRGVKPTVVTYTSLITVYANAGHCKTAIQVFSEMVADKCNPNAVTFTSIINACGREGHFEEAQSMFEAMSEFGVKPNVMTYNAMIDMYSKQGEHKLAQQIFLEMTQVGLEPTSVTLTCLMSSFKAAGAYKEVLTIYERAKNLHSECSVHTYTEALDACVKSKNFPGMARIMADMRTAGCTPNAVTCSVVLVALGSKCSSVDEACQLLDLLEGFDTSIVHCCRKLLSELTVSNAEVTELMEELFGTINRDDVKTWTALSSSLVDALWVLGWYRRAALVLAWVLESGVYDGVCVLTPHEWKLDVRRLSTGGALVALYQWLADLLLVARHHNLLNESSHKGELGSSLSTSTAEENNGALEYEKDGSLRHGTAQVEVLLQLLPSNLKRIAKQGEVSRGRGSGSEVLFGDGGEQLLFPRFVTVVSGWGKLSREEGRSQVKLGVQKEISKLGVPLRPSFDSGRWSAKGEAVFRWLLRPETASRLALWDAAAESPH